MNVTKIIEELGGEKFISYRLNINQYTIKHWYKKGIPAKYWKKLITLSKGTLNPDILFKSKSQ